MYVLTRRRPMDRIRRFIARGKKEKKKRPSAPRPLTKIRRRPFPGRRHCCGGVYGGTRRTTTARPRPPRGDRLVWRSSLGRPRDGKRADLDLLLFARLSSLTVLAAYARTEKRNGKAGAECVRRRRRREKKIR